MNDLGGSVRIKAELAATDVHRLCLALQELHSLRFAFAYRCSAVGESLMEIE